MTETSPIPKDLTGRQRVPFKEIAGYLDVLAEKGDAKDERALTGVLHGRTLCLLRQGSREEIHEEALHLSRFLDSENGKALARKRPELYGNWCALDDLLIEAGRRRDTAAVDSILQSYGGNARRLLEFLAERGAGRESDDAPRVAVARSEVKKHLGLSESHVSHLIRDLEEDDLIFRYRVPGGREVMLELGHLGQRVVSTRVFPSWVTYLVERIAETDEPSHTAPDADTMTRTLVELGAPSEAVARELVGALVGRKQPPMDEPEFVPDRTPDEIVADVLQTVSSLVEQRLDRKIPTLTAPTELFLPPQRAA